MSLPFFLVHPAIVDLHVVFVRKPLSAYGAMLHQLLAQFSTRSLKEYLRELNALVKDTSEQWGLNIIIIHTCGRLTTSELHVTLQFLP